MDVHDRGVGEDFECELDGGAGECVLHVGLPGSRGVRFGTSIVRSGLGLVVAEFDGLASGGGDEVDELLTVGRVFDKADRFALAGAGGDGGDVPTQREEVEVINPRERAGLFGGFLDLCPYGTGVTWISDGCDDVGRGDWGG
ncbi:MAG: hypothetical protein RLN76_08365 [Phycisphaeraceae bacterium]